MRIFGILGNLGSQLGSKDVLMRVGFMTGLVKYIIAGNYVFTPAKLIKNQLKIDQIEKLTNNLLNGDNTKSNLLNNPLSTISFGSIDGAITAGGVLLTRTIMPKELHGIIAIALCMSVIYNIYENYNMKNIMCSDHHEIVMQYSR